MRSRDAIRKAQQDAAAMSTAFGTAADLREAAKEMLRDGETERDSAHGYLYSDDGFSVCARDYVGSFFTLDPCGRYHHMLSPNGITRGCEAYWEALEAEADRLGFSVEGGEGDPIDQYAVVFVADLADLQDEITAEDGAERQVS